MDPWPVAVAHSYCKGSLSRSRVPATMAMVGPGAAVLMREPPACGIIVTISGRLFASCTSVGATAFPTETAFGPRARVIVAAWLCTRIVVGCDRGRPATAYRPSAFVWTGPD